MFKNIPFNRVNWITSSFLIGTLFLSLTAVPAYIWYFGLDWFQVTDLLKAVTQNRCVVGCDIVEVRPIPPNTVTEFLAARLAHRLLGLVSIAS